MAGLTRRVGESGGRRLPLRLSLLVVTTLACIVGAVACGGSKTRGGPKPLTGAHVNVIVRDPTGPKRDVPIAVDDSSGLLVASFLTSDTGGASVVVPSRGSVTVVQTFGAGVYSLTTVVEPPDGALLDIPNVQYYAAPSPASTGTATTFNVTLTTSGALNLKSFQLRNRCETIDASKKTNIKIRDTECPGFETDSLFAFGATTAGLPAAWHYSVALHSSAGHVVNVTAPLDRFELSNLYTDYTGIGAGLKSIQMKVDSIGTDGRAFPEFIHTVGQVTSGEVSIHSRYFAGLVPKTRTLDTVTFATTTASSVVMVRDRRFATLPSSSTFSVSEIARASALNIDTTTPGSPAFSWNVSGPADFGDYVLLGTDWFNAGAEVFARVYLPADHAPSFVYPELGLSPDARPTLDSVFLGRSVGFVDLEAAEDYAGVFSAGPLDVFVTSSYTTSFFYLRD